ncbi:unnamed protein product [Haemonchus placei]|uniref:Transmembrane protein n=1 Tax=Haemonchus placei TaxID=6290 RepID=A0A158QK14_HAEPC|nr:unnamed protein product [Haemonchus placei]
MSVLQMLRMVIHKSSHPKSKNIRNSIILKGMLACLVCGMYNVFHKDRYVPVVVGIVTVVVDVDNVVVVVGKVVVVLVVGTVVVVVGAKSTILRARASLFSFPNTFGNG